MLVKLSNRGDTIVEVLIAIVVVSSVLVGSFAITNSSFKQIRMAQERSEAQKFAESAVESLTGLIDNSADGDSDGLPDLLTRDPASSFCKATADFTLVDANPPALPTPDTACRVGTDDRYKIRIFRQGIDGEESKDFKVEVTWDNLFGRQDNVTIFYKVYFEVSS